MVLSGQDRETDKIEIQERKRLIVSDQELMQSTDPVLLLRLHRAGARPKP